MVKRVHSLVQETVGAGVTITVWADVGFNASVEQYQKLNKPYFVAVFFCRKGLN